MATETTGDTEGGAFDMETMEMLSANLPQNMFRTPDPRLQRAVIEAERTNQMTPMLKEELRLRILTKRMERGEPELHTEFTPKTYELTEEEKEKREKRKAQNRKAAKRCREKRKMKNLDMAEQCELARDRQKRLKSDIHQLRQNMSILDAFMRDHTDNGQCRLAVNTPPPPPPPTPSGQAARHPPGAFHPQTMSRSPSTAVGTGHAEDVDDMDGQRSPPGQFATYSVDEAGDSSSVASSYGPLSGNTDPNFGIKDLQYGPPALILCVGERTGYCAQQETEVHLPNERNLALEPQMSNRKHEIGSVCNLSMSEMLGPVDVGENNILGYYTLADQPLMSNTDVLQTSIFASKSNANGVVTPMALPLAVGNHGGVQITKREHRRESSSCVLQSEANHHSSSGTISHAMMGMCQQGRMMLHACSDSPSMATSSFQTASNALLTPLSPPSSVVSLSPTSPNSISGEMTSPGVNPSPFDLGQLTHRFQNSTTTTTTGGAVHTPSRSSTPKPVTSPRQLTSRASSTASLPPPQSPCQAHHLPPTVCVLTPPPSVSSDFITVPESPSTLSPTPTREIPMHSSGIPSSLFILACNADGYDPQLSPVSPQSRSSANLDVSVDVNMFDDDDDDEGNNETILANVDPVFWQIPH